MDKTQERYLDILKLTLTGILFEDNSIDFKSGCEIPYVEWRRALGGDWPSKALTMVGLARLENIEKCLRACAESGVEGDYLEAGVWRGGASIFAAAVIQELETINGAYDAGTGRKVWLCDSFKGLPPPRDEYPADKGFNLNEIDFLSVSAKEVERNFAKYGLLKRNIHFVEGFFSDTMPKLQAEKIAVLRLDGDLYSSTWEVLVSCYNKIPVGGYVIVDDWLIPPCQQAIKDFRRHESIEDPLEYIDWASVFWRKKK